jgi:hypothetical protein
MPSLPGSATERSVVGPEALHGPAQVPRISASPILPGLRQIAVKMLGGTALFGDAVEKNPAVDAAAPMRRGAPGRRRSHE